MQTAVDMDGQNAVEAFLAKPTEDSFACLFRATGHRVFCYFRARDCEHGLAEDLTQEVMLAVFKQHRQLRSKDLFWAWLFQIARNAWLQHLRRQSRQLALVELDRECENLPSSNRDPLRDSCFSQWMDWLPPEERELVLLRYVEGLEYHEMAATLRLPLGTVQWKLFQLKRKLAARFGGRPV